MRRPFDHAAIAEWLLLFLAVAAPTTVQAQLTHTIADGEVTITGFTGFSGPVVIPESIEGLPVAHIGDAAFYEQRYITSVTLPDTLRTIGNSAFHACSMLDEIVISNGVVSIGDSAFYRCSRLRSAVIPLSVATIGTGAFAQSWLASIFIPGGAIGSGAFSQCTSLTNVVLGTQVTTIGAGAFGYCAMTTISIPDSVTSIGAGAFANCTSLTHANIPSSVTAISDHTFFQSGLTSIFIPDSVSVIGEYAFGSSKLAHVRIPNSVTTIGSSAFASTSLPRVFIPQSVSVIGSFALGSCLSLTNIVVDPHNPAYTDEGGVLFTKDHAKIVQYPVGKEGGYYVVPVGVTNIGVGAFFRCRLAGISLPNTVTTIDSSAFGSSHLRDIYIPDSVTAIGRDAFRDCASLARMIIPDSVTVIGPQAFQDCASLIHITIGKGITSLNRDTFRNCAQLRRVYFRGHAPNPMNAAFRNSNLATVYYLPETTGWSATFDGRPTVLWNPRMLIDDGQFGLQAGKFGFTIHGAPDIPVVVEACFELANPGWTPVAFLTLNAEGTAQFTDPVAAMLPARAYRFRAE
jgi:hypothetical protein